MQIVSVQFEDKYSSDGGYGGRNYSYFSAIPLKVGDEVIAPTKHGESKAVVTAVDLPVSAIAAFKDAVKTIERLAQEEEEEASKGEASATTT